MSSLVQGSQQTPNSQRPMGIDVVRCVDSGMVLVLGSFQGFATQSTAGGPEGYDPRQTRGNYFTVATNQTGATTVGRYRVTLNGVVPLLSYSGVQPTQAPGTTASPGWPTGLLLQPQAWVTNNFTPGLLPPFLSIAGNQVDFFTTIYCTPFDLTTNSFTIQAYGLGAIPNAARDFAPGDRINFSLSFKSFGFTP